MKIKSIQRAAFTLVEIMIVVAIIGLLAAIAIPNFVRARTTAQQNACINNLRQMDGAVQQWALEQKKSAAQLVNTTDITPYIKLTAVNNLPECPGGGAYSTSDVGNHPACSLSTLTTAPHKLP